MAKSKYESNVQPKLQLVKEWAQNGLTEKQIAKNLGISRDTLNEYKKKYPDFSDLLKKGKEVSDEEVENALYKAALGGNITAQIFWLKNRRPEKWRDKPDTDKKEAIEIIVKKEIIDLRGDSVKYVDD